jgi:hypothetical protein
MKACEKWDLMMLNSKTLKNFHISNSQKLQLFTYKRHEKTSLSSNIRIKCVTKQFIFSFFNEYNQ